MRVGGLRLVQLERPTNLEKGILGNGGENYICCHFVFVVVFSDAIAVVCWRLVYGLHRNRY